ncbi:hypothetical protein D4764_21G0002960 [Takifugu flavidus]|uniref:Uncharacterized protein n=1 Tax=Takifugu flavidus TaxID=433684 RepID=A0A5C6NE63_9TELE|nr:hypothetical protein D4764_21G0002960 [Takifugu flavidus]
MGIRRKPTRRGGERRFPSELVCAGVGGERERGRERERDREREREDRKRERESQLVEKCRLNRCVRCVLQPVCERVRRQSSLCGRSSRGQSKRPGRRRRRRRCAAAFRTRFLRRVLPLDHRQLMQEKSWALGLELTESVVIIDRVS